MTVIGPDSKNKSVNWLLFKPFAILKIEAWGDFPGLQLFLLTLSVCNSVVAVI